MDKCHGCLVNWLRKILPHCLGGKGWQICPHRSIPCWGFRFLSIYAILLKNVHSRASKLTVTWFIYIYSWFLDVHYQTVPLWICPKLLWCWWGAASLLSRIHTNIWKRYFLLKIPKYLLTVCLKAVMHPLLLWPKDLAHIPHRASTTKWGTWLREIDLMIRHRLFNKIQTVRFSWKHWSPCHGKSSFASSESKTWQNRRTVY